MKSNVLFTIFAMVAAIGSISGCVYSTAILATFLGVIIADCTGSSRAAGRSLHNQRSYV